MRLSNRNKVSFYRIIHSSLLFFFTLGVIFFLIDRYRMNMMGSINFLLVLIPLLFLLGFHIKGRQIFEYDSDGETLNIKNWNINYIFTKKLSHEFPKYKIIKYEVLNFIILKRLFVTINSKKGHPLILKYDISFLTKKELKDLKYSLNKIVKTNNTESSLRQENK